MTVSFDSWANWKADQAQVIGIFGLLEGRSRPGVKSIGSLSSAVTTAHLKGDNHITCGLNNHDLGPANYDNF